jgi:hypothetical protein
MIFLFTFHEIDALTMCVNIQFKFNHLYDVTCSSPSLLYVSLFMQPLYHHHILPHMQI